MQAEIQLHKLLTSNPNQEGARHIVRFHRFFEDQNNVYILLELCEN